jgi:hypothetical protein
MNLEKYMLKQAVKKMAKNVFNVDSFELLRFSIDGKAVSYEIDGVADSGDLTEKDIREITKMIPVKGFSKMVGDLTMNSLLVNITSIDSHTKEEHLEIISI